MPLHSVFITNRGGALLLSKYFLPSITTEERAVWEQQLFRATRFGWDNAADGSAQIATLRGQYVVYLGFGGMLLFLAGSDEYDEVTLATIGAALVDVIVRLCEAKDASSLGDAQILSVHGKICVAVEEMVNEGTLEHLDADTILKMSKLKAQEVGD